MANAQEAQKPKEQKPPRVLILGDVVYHQLSRDLQKELGKSVELVMPRTEPGEVFHSTHLLAELDELLGEETWDLIHFNCGLGDLIHRAANMQSFRILPIPAGGVRSTEAKEYEANLRAIVKRLQATKAKLVWASTTPIRASSSKVFELGSEIEYNLIAAKIMRSNKVEINDMYTHVRDLIDMDKPASHGADPFFFDRKPIHQPLVELIRRSVGVDPPE